MTRLETFIKDSRIDYIIGPIMFERKKGLPERKNFSE